MPKSKHGRGKHSHKRSKFRQMPAGTGAAPPAADNIAKAVAPTTIKPVTPTTVQKKPVAASAVLPVQHEYITGDLKRIGILTIIILAILIILYLFLK